MSKGKGEIRQRIKNGVAYDNGTDKIKIKRIRKKDSQKFSLNRNHLLAIWVSICLLILIFYAGYQVYLHYNIARVKTPLNFPLVISEDSLDDTYFWGTYRPQLFFGMKSLSKYSIKTGLMWFTQPHRVQKPDIRYWCRVDDGIRHFSWELHDGKYVGKQNIYDQYQTIVTSFTKNNKNWVNRIEVKNVSKSVSTSLMYYLYLPELNSAHIKPIIKGVQLLAIEGIDSNSKKFKMSFNFKTEPKNKYHNSFLISHVPREDKILQTIESGLGVGQKDRLIGLIGSQQIHSSNSENIWVFELTGSGTMTLDVIYESYDQNSEKLSSDTFQNYYSKYAEQFYNKFNMTFQNNQIKRWSPSQVKLAESALSQLIGGIGHFYGESLVLSPWSFKKEKEPQPLKYWPVSLLTSTPSRTIFPRGFLWDEGFHTLLLSKWDLKLSLSIIGHWLDTMNIEGWIPREQILGWEARAKVPEEFIIQNSKNGNPPTFILTLEDINDQFDGFNEVQKSLFSEFLKKAIPRLETWFNWFNSTQIGSGYANYQWKGRNLNNRRHLNPLTLTSGLDDYPRASHPTLEERHIDLRCWMAEFSLILGNLLKRIDNFKAAEKYLQWSDVLRDEQLLDSSHWDNQRNIYTDWGLNSEAVELQNRQVSPKSDPQIFENIRVEHDSPKFGSIPHIGYVNFFPLFLRILKPNSQRLGQLLKELEKPELIWTKYGLRSLARTSRFYRKKNSEHDPPYWRGAIWINMNMLAVRSLAYYSQLKGPYQDTARKLHDKLKTNVVNCVLDNMDRTGYLWEQYDDLTGQGQRGHPFSGWTSLVVLMM